MGPMKIARIIPDLHSSNIEASKKFYAEFLGLSLEMDMGWVLTFVSPSNPTAQLTLLKTDGSNELPGVSIEVEDADDLHAKALALGLDVVYPLTEEPWGVKRFFVKDPNGYIINCVSHSK